MSIELKWNLKENSGCHKHLIFYLQIVKGDGRQVGKLFLEHSVNECHDSESFVEEMASLVKDLR